MYASSTTRFALQSRLSAAAALFAVAAAGSAQAQPDDAAAAFVCFEPHTTASEMRAVLQKSAHPGAAVKTRPSLGRITSTAHDPQGAPPGRGLTITWSYLRDGNTIPATSDFPGNSPSSLYATLNADFPGGFAAWHAQMQRAFELWGRSTGNIYRYEPNDDGAPFRTADGAIGVRGDIRIGMRELPGKVLAYNYSPGDGSDMVLDSSFPAWSYGDYLMEVVAHELGHGIGLDHVCPMDGTKLMEPAVDLSSVGPQLDDVLGAQMLYGDALRGDGSAQTAAPALPARQQLLGVRATADSDWFTLSGPGPVRVEVSPVAGNYLEGPQVGDVCSAGQPYDISRFGDLAVIAYSGDATVELGRADAGGPGDTETLNYRGSAGDVQTYVQVTNTGSGYQLYRIRASSAGHAIQLITRGRRVGEAIFRDGFD